MQSHKADTEVATNILIEEPLSLSLNSTPYDTCKSAPMIGENQQLITNEPVEFEK